MPADVVSLAEARSRLRERLDRLPLAIVCHVGAVELIVGTAFDEDAIELHMSPEQALELAEDLRRTALAAKGGSVTLPELLAQSSVGVGLARLKGWARLGARLARHRASARMTIAAVARYSNLSWSRAHQIEQGCAGSEPPRDAELVAICRALGVEPTAFLEDAARVRKGVL